MYAKAPPAMRVEDGSSGWSNVLILCSRSSHSTLRCPFQTHWCREGNLSGSLAPDWGQRAEWGEG